ncbi:MAG: L-lactate dehydrogenase [Caldilineaceae bacterium]|nr:L-lactate dehydrogenase [Caldilineaceae bacterium]
MKVGVVGTGLVGATAAFALAVRGVASQIVLVDKNMARAEAEADDILHAVPFVQPARVWAGDYADLKGARVVIVAAGVGQRPGESRLELLNRNAAVFRAVIPSILEHAPDAILLIATNPVDVMTHLAAHFAAEGNVPAQRVLGSGTTLDTARFRALLGRQLGVDPGHVHAYVVGEHGDSEVLTWSQVRVGNLTLDEFCAMQHAQIGEAQRAQIDDRVRRAAYHIIEGKGATYYGIAGALSAIAAAILRDQRTVLTVCHRNDGVQGVEDVTLALPHLVGGDGVLATFPLSLSDAEAAALKQSAQVIRTAIDQLNL